MRLITKLKTYPGWHMGAQLWTGGAGKDGRGKGVGAPVAGMQEGGVGGGQRQQVGQQVGGQGEHEGVQGTAEQHAIDKDELPLSKWPGADELHLDRWPCMLARAAVHKGSTEGKGRAAKAGRPAGCKDGGVGGSGVSCLQLVAGAGSVV